VEQALRALQKSSILARFYLAGGMPILVTSPA